MVTYNFTRHPPPISIYTRFRVKNSFRAVRSPRVAKRWRTRKLMNLTAFFRNRFYEIDRWYKARIEKPEMFPTCYTIEPENHIKSLEERLSEINLDANKNREPINIGMPFDARKVFGKDLPPKDDVLLERLARLMQLRLDPVDVDADALAEQVTVRMAKGIAEHYGIFRDLFHPDAFFYPVVNMHVEYVITERPDSVTPAFYGNSLSPAETASAPDVIYNGKPDKLYTLLMVNPDGCVFEEDKDVMHWLVCNVPGNDIAKGDVFCPYMQPLPLKGTGWHRMVFLLFEQDRRLNELSIGKIEEPQELQRRSFSTADFYLKNEDHITPVGLAFFQTSWDKSCTTYFHEILKMEQPMYAYEWPTPYFEPQEEFPAEYQSFNEYLDKYRNYKDIDRELFLKRLSAGSPFKADAQKLKFPNIFYNEHRFLPTWQKVEKIKEAEGYGKYKSLYENPLD